MANGVWYSDIAGFVPQTKAAVVTHLAVVIVGQLNRGTVEALGTQHDEVIAVHVVWF